jgi:hypothetical protein
MESDSADSDVHSLGTCEVVNFTIASTAMRCFLNSLVGVTLLLTGNNQWNQRVNLCVKNVLKLSYMHQSKEQFFWGYTLDPTNKENGKRGWEWDWWGRKRGAEGMGRKGKRMGGQKMRGRDIECGEVYFIDIGGWMLLTQQSKDAHHIPQG